MRFSQVAIAGMGYELPPAVLSSAEIEDRLSPVYQRIGLIPGRLEALTGVVERRYWPGVEPMRPSQAAARAGRKALEASGVPRSEIGLLIHASVCRDFLEPATAALVHRALELPDSAQLFDLSNACLGVANAMLIAGQMIESGAIRAALIVSGENGRPLLDATIDRLNRDLTVTRRSIKPSIASLTIGSGAFGVVLSRAGSQSKLRLLGGTALARTEHHGLCQGDGDLRAMEMETDAEALLEAGVALAKHTWAAFLNELGWPANPPPHAITHQVGRAHSQALEGALGLDPQAGFHTYRTLGNMGSASMPITFARALEEGWPASAQRIALLGIGSGLSTVFLGVEAQRS